MVKTIIIFILCTYSAWALDPFTPINNIPSGKALKLWATNYYTPIKNAGEGDYPLLTMDDDILLEDGQEARVSHHTWCDAAMEGSITLVFDNNHEVTFNYAGKTTFQVDCSPYFGNRFPNTNKVRFRRANSRWGDGVKNYSLIPYRTIAVDRRYIPYGSVIYIPKAKGKLIQLRNGQIFIHDGYFFAGDTGSAIKKNHIDVFTGNDLQHNLNFIRSSSRHKFDAILIKNSQTIKFLRERHLKRW